MREQIKQLIDKLEEPFGLVYYKGIPICKMSNAELQILCTWLTEIHFKGEKITKVITYDGYVHCSNCDRSQSVEIPKGITIKEYRVNKICFYCGCKIDGGE